MSDAGPWGELTGFGGASVSPRQEAQGASCASGHPGAGYFGRLLLHPTFLLKSPPPGPSLCPQDRTSAPSHAKPGSELPGMNSL